MIESSGRYLLGEVVASGGMASVHLGCLRGGAGFSRVVAIKRLHPHLLDDRNFVDMFIDEARLCARIRHPNVIPTLDVEEAGNSLQLVMEYVEGVSLSEILRTVGKTGARMPLPVVSAVIQGLLRGLHAAHEATDSGGTALHLVHRDVSPQNVLVGSDGVARVFDFGVAKAVGRLQTTRDGHVKGKLSYMSPEQLSGNEVDRRTDVYASGVVLWETLTGQRLFQAENPGHLMQAVLTWTIPPPSEKVPEGEAFPSELDVLVEKAVRKNPLLRFETTLEMATALDRVIPAAGAPLVAAWLRETAGAVLEARRKMVTVMESQVRADPTSGPRGELRDPAGRPWTGSATTSEGVSRPIDELPTVVTSANTPRRFGRATLVSGVAVFVIGLATSLYLWDQSAGELPKASANGGLPLAGPVPVADSGADDLLPLRGAPPLPAAELGAAASASEPKSPSLAPHPTPTPGPKLPSQKTLSTGAAECSPPYTIDPVTGHRKIKRACL